MADRRELWRSIRALPHDDRNWLLAQLSGWPEFQHFLALRADAPSGSVETLQEEASCEKDGVSVGRATLVFDGGSRGNPGPSYGSYALRFDDGPPQVSHLDFEEDMTNNEAEYETLIRALEDLLGRLTDVGVDPRQQEVTVQGDSRLVINQVTGAWKARNQRMLQRRNRVRELLRSLGCVSFEEKGRDHIEGVLGH